MIPTTTELPRGGFWGDLFSFLGLRSGDAKFLMVGSFNFKCRLEVPSSMIYLSTPISQWSSSWSIQLSHPSEKLGVLSESLSCTDQVVWMYDEQSWICETLLGKAKTNLSVGIEGRADTSELHGKTISVIDHSHPLTSVQFPSTQWKVNNYCASSWCGYVIRLESCVHIYIYICNTLIII